MNERDELAEVYADILYRYHGIITSQSREVANELIGAGYRKPRTITTAEELGALPRASVIRSDSGEIWEKFSNSWDNLSETGDSPYPPSEVALPATVLYEPPQ